MTRIGDIIRELRQNLGMSVDDLAKKIGKNRATIYRYENSDIETLPTTILEPLAKALRTTPAYLMGWEDTDEESPAVRINVYGTVPAGIPLEAVEDIRDWEEIPREWTTGGQEYMALIVDGDSMYPKYIEGDVVIVKLQPDCESGMDCVVYVNGYNATLKKVLKNEDGSITLEPYNRTYPPKRYGKGDDPISILGVVKELRRKII